jgi:hypothetical protein
MHFMKIARIACCGALALAGLTAQAGPTSVLEVKIELRVMDFIAEPANRSAVAVLYDRDLHGSMDEADAILDALEESRELVRNKISPRLVEVHALSSAKGLKAVILPASLATANESVMQYGVANQTLVLSSGSGCLRSHRCMVGVSTSPDVEIGIDSRSIHAGNIHFADGFQLMVKEY